MNTIKALGYASLSSIALTLLTPVSSIAEVEQTTVSTGSGSHSLVQRVSHSLAGAQSYTSGAPSGYKWGRKVEQRETDAQWAESRSVRGSYKWGNTSATAPEAQSFAGNASYQWGVRNYAEQAGYKWRLSNFAKQTGYKWRLSNFAQQAGYKWRLSNFAEQAGYKWRLSSFAEQAGYKWRLSSFAEQAGYKWRLSSLVK